MGWWGYRSWGPYPGRGPFAHLPPWLRPGNYLGWCGWWRPAYPLSREEEARYLKELKYSLQKWIEEIDKRLAELGERA